MRVCCIYLFDNADVSILNRTRVFTHVRSVGDLLKIHFARVLAHVVPSFHDPRYRTLVQVCALLCVCVCVCVCGIAVSELSACVWVRTRSMYDLMRQCQCVRAFAHDLI